MWTETNFEDKKASLLGLPKESDWMLYAPYHDKTLIRNVLTYNWSNDMGLYALRSRPVELFFTETGGKITLDSLNGGNTDYRGIYILMERIKIDDERVDIANVLEKMPSSKALNTGIKSRLSKSGKIGRFED